MSVVISFFILSQKILFILLSMMIIIPVIMNSAYAEYDIMTPEQRKQIWNQVPNFQGNNINYFFQIIITPTGQKQTNVILSSENYTALKNNVAFFTACGDFISGLCQPPVVTMSTPTTNYCPLAKLILENQDGYLPKLYNKTLGKDLTDFIYPPYCYAETGPNTISGKAINPIPEFPTTAILIIPILFVVLISTWWIKFTGKSKI